MNYNKILRIISLILISVLFLVLTTACQSSPQLKERSSNVVSGGQTLSTSKLEPARTVHDSKGQEQSIEQKIIKRATIRLEAKNLDQISTTIINKIKEYDGHISNSRSWQSNKQRQYYNYTIRVPQPNFEVLLSEIKELGTVKDERINGQDVTMEYMDLKSRVKNFKHQEQRYLELLEQAKNVEDILKIENELNRVRRNIEQIEGRIRYYDNQLSLSTINLQLSEPQPIINNSLGFLNSFKEAITGFINSINYIIILTGSLVPWLILLVIISFVLYKIIRYYKL